MRNNRFACPCCSLKTLTTKPLPFTRARIQEENPVIIVMPSLKIEHLADRAGDSIERSLAYAVSAKPVIFDETND
jgi:hypothetical protein